MTIVSALVVSGALMGNGDHCGFTNVMIVGTALFLTYGAVASLNAYFQWWEDREWIRWF